MHKTFDYDFIKSLFENNYKSCKIDGKTYYFKEPYFVVGTSTKDSLNIFYGNLEGSNEDTLLAILKDFEMIKTKGELKVTKSDVALVKKRRYPVSELSSKSGVLINESYESKLFPNPTRELRKIRRNQLYSSLTPKTKKGEIANLRREKLELLKAQKSFLLSPVANPYLKDGYVVFNLPEGYKIMIKEHDDLFENDNVVVNQLNKKSSFYLENRFDDYCLDKIRKEYKVSKEDRQKIADGKTSNYDYKNEAKVLIKKRG